MSAQTPTSSHVVSSVSFTRPPSAEVKRTTIDSTVTHSTVILPTPSPCRHAALSIMSSFPTSFSSVSSSFSSSSSSSTSSYSTTWTPPTPPHPSSISATACAKAIWKEALERQSSGLCILLVQSGCRYSSEARSVYESSAVAPHIPLMVLDTPSNYLELLSVFCEGRHVFTAREVGSIVPLPAIPPVEIVPQILFAKGKASWIAWEYGVDGVRSMIRILEHRRTRSVAETKSGSQWLASSSTTTKPSSVASVHDKSVALAPPNQPSDVESLIAKWGTLLFWYPHDCPYSTKAMALLSTLGQPFVHVDMSEADSDLKEAIVDSFNRRLPVAAAADFADPLRFPIRAEPRTRWTAPLFFHQGVAVGGSDEIESWAQSRPFLGPPPRGPPSSVPSSTSSLFVTPPHAPLPHFPPLH